MPRYERRMRKSGEPKRAKERQAKEKEAKMARKKALVDMTLGMGSWVMVVIVAKMIMILVLHLNTVKHLLYSPKKVTHNILVDRQVQLIVAVTCVLYISYVIEYKE